MIRALSFTLAFSIALVSLALGKDQLPNASYSLTAEFDEQDKSIAVIPPMRPPLSAVSRFKPIRQWDGLHTGQKLIKNSTQTSIKTTKME